MHCGLRQHCSVGLKIRINTFAKFSKENFFPYKQIRLSSLYQRVITSPAATHQTYPAEKKRTNFKEEQHFRREQWSQQLFSAGFLSSSSQQLFSAAFLSSLSQQLFSAALLSSLSQQLFSAAFLSSSSQQLFSAIILLWSGVGGQLVTSPSAALLSSSSQLSSCCGQGLVVSY